MRILLVTPYYIPAWGFGGPVKVVADLAQALYQQGNTVTIATTDALEANKRIGRADDVINGIPVHYFPNVSSVAAFRWNVYLPRGFRQWLTERIKDFDIIHCHDFYTGLNYIVSQVANRNGVPYVIQPHGALIPTRITSKFAFIKKLWLILFKQVLRRAARVIASTEQERQEIIKYQHLPAEQVAVIPNGLAVAEVYRRVNDNNVRRRLDIADQEYVILYFGRIQFIKGLDISLRSLALLPELSWKFIIVGRDDGQQAALRDLGDGLKISERVKFVGPKFGEELNALMGISDVFLFNSRSESFPIAVLNACAAGLPAVLSPECRVPEVAGHGAGIVLADNSPRCTADALRKLLPDTKTRELMRSAGQQLVREMFSMDRVVTMYLTLYSRMLTRP